MKKLAKKQTGGTSNSTVKKKTITDVSRNPQYKSSGVMNTDGKMVYQRIKGSGPSKVAEGTSAPSNYKKGGSVTSKKISVPKKSGMLKKGGVVKAKKK